MRKLRVFIISIAILSVVHSATAQTCLRAKDISGGEYHSMVLMEDGTLWACGDNEEGQLGNDDPYNQYELVQVHDGEMETGSGFLENIASMDAREEPVPLPSKSLLLSQRGTVAKQHTRIFAKQRCGWNYHSR